MSRYSGSFIHKDKISSVKHSHQVFYFITSRLYINNLTRLCHPEHFTSPTQYLLLIIYPSTNTSFVPTTSTETTTLSLDPLNSSYVTKTDFTTTTKDLMTEFKEFVKGIIADQDANFFKIIEE